MRPKTEESYSTRCRISHRPPYRTAEPVFYRCESCGALIVKNLPGGVDPTESGVSCCGKQLQPLELCRDEAVLKEHELGFTVFGGFEKNAIRFTVDGGTHPMHKDHRIEWMYLRTYQGGQVKYLPLNSRSVAMFAMAEEDAYVYCDRDICRMGREHCQFECKRGNTVYAYCTVHGLMCLTLTGF